MFYTIRLTSHQVFDTILKMKTDFRNLALRIDSNEQPFRGPGNYSFDRVPKLLFAWSRLFQSVVSQGGTFLLTGSFHGFQCAIYKAEGGCRIAGVGDLVLGSTRCYFNYADRSKKTEKQTEAMADFISEIVLAWNPLDPIESMLNTAAKHLATNTKKSLLKPHVDNLKKDGLKGIAPLQEAIKLALRMALESGREGGPFSGNALSDFFEWNPFSDAPVDRDYFRFCLVQFDGKTEEEVNQQFADEDLGKEYNERINSLIRKANPNSYSRTLCCSPKRSENGNELAFWINTGRSTQIDGWKTPEDIEAFLQSDGILVERQLV